jgi:hypothetical protein
MVVYTLSIKANLKGVASLAMVTDDSICLDVRNPVDVLDKRERIVVDATDLEHVAEAAHAKHHEKPCHFTLKWSDGSRGTILILKQKDGAVPGTGDVTQSGVYTPVMSMECENVEPYALHLLGTEFSVTNHAGVKFEKVDLSRGSWSEFDLGTGATEVTEFESKIV